MKVFRQTVPLIVLAIVALAATLFAFPGGDAEKGLVLFHDPTFAGATTGMSCGSCHVSGKGLADTGDKETWRVMGKQYKHLEDAINYMITTALHGKPLDSASPEMTHVVAYVKSL